MKKSILPVFAFVLLAAAACDRGADRDTTVPREDTMSSETSRTESTTTTEVPSQQPGTVESETQNAEPAPGSMADSDSTMETDQPNSDNQ